MKLKLLKLTKLFLFCFVIILSSCEKDDTDKIQNTEVKNDNLSIKYVSGKDIPNIISKLDPNYLSTNSTNGLKSNTISDAFGSISVENIIEAIDSLENKNYSFALTPKKPKPNSIFNLVISTSKGNVEMAIIEYRMAPNFAQAYRNGTKSMTEFTGNILRYPFNGAFNLSNKTSRTTCVQNIDEVVNCDEIIVDAGSTVGTGGGGGSTTIYSTYTYTGGDGGTVAHNYGTSGGTVGWICNAFHVLHDGPTSCGDGTGTWVIKIFPASHTSKLSGASNRSSCCDGTNIAGYIPINTNESVCPTCSSDPCDKIKSNTSSTRYMESFSNINKPTILALPYEYGFAQVSDTYTFSQAVGGESIPIPNGAKNYTHTHPNRSKVDEDGNAYHGNVKIHSPDDIYQLIVKCQRNNGTDPKNAFGITISDEGIFALSILEPFIFDKNMQDHWTKFEDDYKDKATQILSDYKGFSANEINIRKMELQKMLLSFLKDLGLENKIGLFEGTEDNSNEVAKIKWQRKKLNDSGSLTSENC